MRAVLLASATATTSGGRRRRSPITHGSALVAFERSKLALAPLIRSRRKYWLPRLDDDDLDLVCFHVGQQPLQRRPLGRAPGIPAVIVAGPDQGPAGMGLTADIGLRGVILGIERVEVLLKPGLGRDAGVDGAADRFDGLARHGRTSDGD